MDSTTPAIAADAGFEVPAVLDIEASGVGSDGHPIEVGFVLPDGASYCSLIRPEPGWTHWDPQAERTHRIALATVLARGRDVAEVATQLNQRLQGRTLYCEEGVRQNAWLGMLFAAARLAPSFRLEDLRMLLSDTEAAFWGILKQQIATEMGLQRHRASSDARILQRTLMRLRGPLPAPP